ncbi:hypothetical protein MKS88_002693 [Plasmodium brasilianum]|uniref:Uncharacterized protein n=3 Tax=Plasmodium (Plasmodium) TaxID=418103 RepID=A0A1D3PBD0_PLAMA|nr:conserved Plasmodium protein, unknown function [Plasmodium malariae]KAI4838220.1 hypothetical protein MKS88_002693 [Plasmodium brasilianum]SCN12616.1 conserved Plasmodium protein, unknown function [Plasmodium malariae]
MGNVSTRDENVKRSLILLDDKLVHNLEKKNNNTNTEINAKELGEENALKEICSVAKPASPGENEYDALRKRILNDLIKEREIYMNSQKDILYNIKEHPNSLKIPQTHNECFHDENKIYKCLKNMNDSTSTFVNSYARCCRYLREYESCVQKIKT